MHRSARLICAAGAVLWTSAASAETLRTFKVENWSAGAYTRRGTSQFNHCAASARYKSGVSMMFAVNRRYGWSMGFASPEWSLVRGNNYDITFQIDDAAPTYARAVAIRDNQVEVQLDDSSALFQQFRWGRLLRVRSQGRLLRFQLTDTSLILPELLRCVQHYVGTAPPASASNFFGGSQPKSSSGFFGGSPPANTAPAPAPTPAVAGNGAARAEATTLAANLLAQSGISGFQILGPNDLGNLKADAAWKAAGVIGTISVLNADGVTLERIPGRLIGSAAQGCTGKFFSGSLPDTQDGAAIVRAFTACQKGDNTLTVYYLGVPRPSGGFYVMTTSAIGSEQPAKEADQNLRSAVYKVLSK